MGVKFDSHFSDFVPSPGKPAFNLDAPAAAALHADGFQQVRQGLAGSQVFMTPVG